MVALLTEGFIQIFYKIKNLIGSDQIKNIIIEGHERFWRVSGNYSNKIEKNWLYANKVFIQSI